jgi:hypothetical protein
MNTTGQLEQHIDDLLRGVLSGARQVALSAVAEAFARNEGRLLSERLGQPTPGPSKKRGERTRRPAKKRSPDELATLGERLCAEICKKPGETMTYYATRLSSTAVKLGVPVRRLVEEERVHAIGDRNQRKYYPGGRE